MTATTADRVRTKRVYDAPSPRDGRRILITRYWPRGVPKAAADEYNPKLAPSRDLVRAYKDEFMCWDDFARRYLGEMAEDAAQAEIARLAAEAQRQTITLMCMCEDESHCHRSLAAGLVRAAMTKQS